MQPLLAIKHPVNHSGKYLNVCPELEVLLKGVRPIPRVPGVVSVKKISTDMLYAALDNCDALGNGDLYHRVMQTHNELGFENLIVYHGIILGKEADLNQLHNPNDPTSIPVRGMMIPKGYVVYAFVLIKALLQRLELVSNRQTAIVVKIFLSNTLSYLAHCIAKS